MCLHAEGASLKVQGFVQKMYTFWRFFFVPETYTGRGVAWLVLNPSPGHPDSQYIYTCMYMVL